MKSLIIFCVLMLVGCSSSDILQYDFKKNTELTANIGQPMTVIHRKMTNSPSDVMEKMTYMGRSGLTIRILYEEYVNNYQAPSFGQLLKFDLMNGYVITYRDIRLEIMSVDRDHITFKVLQY